MNTGSDKPVSSPLLELGRRLREARERKGLTAEQVAERTRIPLRHVRELESGDVATMPAPVYARGFVRNLARILDLEEEPLLVLMDQGGIAAPAATQASEAIGHVAAAARDAGMLGRIPPTWWAAAGGVLVVGMLVGVGIRGCVRSMAANATRQVPPSPFQSRQEAGKPAPQVPRKAAPAEALSPNEAAAVRVSVTAFQDCWMDTQLDDQMPVQVEMKAGDERVFEAATRVRLHIGNPSGVRIIGPRGPVKLRARAGRTEHLLFFADHMERIRLPVPVSATAAEGQ